MRNPALFISTPTEFMQYSSIYLKNDYIKYMGNTYKIYDFDCKDNSYLIGTDSSILPNDLMWIPGNEIKFYY